MEREVLYNLSGKVGRHYPEQTLWPFAGNHKWLLEAEEGLCSNRAGQGPDSCRDQETEAQRDHKASSFNLVMGHILWHCIL